MKRIKRKPLRNARELSFDLGRTDGNVTRWRVRVDAMRLKQAKELLNCLNASIAEAQRLNKIAHDKALEFGHSLSGGAEITDAAALTLLKELLESEAETPMRSELARLYLIAERGREKIKMYDARLLARLKAWGATAELIKPANVPVAVAEAPKQEAGGGE